MNEISGCFYIGLELPCSLTSPSFSKTVIIKTFLVARQKQLDIVDKKHLYKNSFLKNTDITLKYLYMISNFIFIFLKYGKFIYKENQPTLHFYDFIFLLLFSYFCNVVKFTYVNDVVLLSHIITRR